MSRPIQTEKERLSNNKGNSSQTNELIRGMIIHPSIFHQQELLSQMISVDYSQIKFGEDVLFDMSKIYYSQNPSKDLGATKVVYIGCLNESVEFCEENGCPFDCCNVYPGVIVYSLDDFNNKKVLFEYENSRCLGGCCVCCPYNTRLTTLKRNPNPEGEPIKMETVRIRPNLCYLITLFFFHTWFYIFTVLGRLFSLCRCLLGFFGCEGQMSCFCINFTKDIFIDDGNGNTKEGNVTYAKGCFLCGDMKGFVYLNGQEKYTLRSKQLKNTCCLTRVGGCNCCGQAYLCCYDRTGIGFRVLDIINSSQQKVGEMGLYERTLGREDCCCCSFYSPRNIIRIKFPDNATIDDKYALIAFGVNFGKRLSIQGKSY